MSAIRASQQRGAHSEARPPPTRLRAFAYRAGVRIVGTVVACDAATGGRLIFLSHAEALGSRARRGAAPRAQPAPPDPGRPRPTLALLGPAGERLRPHALVAGLGRPFVLGELRLELFRSGHAPGAASLLCERRRARARRLRGAGRPATRTCASGRALPRRAFGAPAVRLPPRAEALAAMSPGS